MRAYLSAWYKYEDGLAHVTREDNSFRVMGEEESICGKYNAWVHTTADPEVPHCQNCELLNTMLILAE